MLALTLPRRIWAHSIPAGYKLVALAVASVLIFPVQNVLLLLVLLAAIVVLHLTAGRDVLRYALTMMRPVMFFAAIIGVFHLLTFDIYRGIAIVLRMVILVGMANFVTMTTALDDMIAVLNWLMTPLTRLGVRTQAVSLAIAMVIRFTPTLIEKGSVLIESWRARSRKRPNWRVTIPLCILALDDAEHVAEALRARGGIAPSHKT
jgi:biotin transport system permease protein